MLYPLRFTPAYKDYIWGGRNLENFGKVLPDGIIAEIWEISAHKDGLSIVSEGDLKGYSIPELINKFGTEFAGTDLSEKDQELFPLLIKLIDANNNLSVQVHPDDEYAFINENGELGKNEMWYILDAKPGSTLIYDVTEGTTKEKFAEAIKNGTVENTLNTIEVFPGDVINIPAGLVHAIGKGIILAEIQQNSNTTYRVYDYDRKDAEGNSRPLHIEKSLDTIDFRIEKGKEKCQGIVSNLPDGGTKNNLIANKYFSVEKYSVKSSIEEKADGSKFYIYIFTEGNCTIFHDGKEYLFGKGDTVLVPASIGEYTMAGTFEMLKTYVPNIDQDVVLPLLREGYIEEDINEKIAGLK